MPTSSQALTLLKQFTAISHSIQYPIEVPETVSSLVPDVCLQEFDEIKDSESILHDNPQQTSQKQPDVNKSMSSYVVLPPLSAQAPSFCSNRLAKKCMRNASGLNTERGSLSGNDNSETDLSVLEDKQKTNENLPQCHITSSPSETNYQKDIIREDETSYIAVIWENGTHVGTWNTQSSPPPEDFIVQHALTSREDTIGNNTCQPVLNDEEGKLIENSRCKPHLRPKTAERIPLNEDVKIIPSSYVNNSSSFIMKEQNQNVAMKNSVYELNESGLQVSGFENMETPLQISYGKNDEVVLSSDYFSATTEPIHYGDYTHIKKQSVNQQYLDKIGFQLDGKSWQYRGLRRRKKPFLTCTLNLKFCNQFTGADKNEPEDNSSCVGVLSYNHQMGRHVWNLVPQSTRTQGRFLQGRCIKNKNSGDCQMQSSSSEQREWNFLTDFATTIHPSKFRALSCLGTPASRDALVNRSTGSFSLRSSIQNFSGKPEENAKSNTREEEREEYLREDCANMKQEKTSTDLSGWNQRLPIIAQTEPANNRTKSKKIHRRIATLATLAEVLPSDLPGKLHSLTSSGIIEQGSYFFDKSDSIDRTPRFLETLSTAPKQNPRPNESSSDLTSNYSQQEAFQNDQLMKTSCPSSLKYSNNKPPKTFTGLTLRQKQKAISVTQQRSSLPKVEAESSRKISSETPAVTQPSSAHSENEENLAESDDHSVCGEDVPLSESSSNLSAHADLKIIRMRSELPPLQPNRLCFRTSLSGCSHAEVVTEIESQKNVNVRWLQYEPISLQYADIARPDYRHLSMWLFELTPDSDTSGLLLEGFMLRGQHVNVVRVDDVYLEEFRTYSMCNEVFMEQVSKKLVKNNPRRLLRSAKLMVKTKHGAG